MDKFVKQALKTRAVFMLSFVVIAMMAVLVTHAGAMDLSATQITTISTVTTGATSTASVSGSVIRGNGNRYPAVGKSHVPCGSYPPGSRVWINQRQEEKTWM